LNLQPDGDTFSVHDKLEETKDEDFLDNNHASPKSNKSTSSPKRRHNKK